MKFDFKLPAAVSAILGKFKIIAKHHYFIAFVVLFSGLALGIYMVNQTLNLPSDQAYRDTQLHSTLGSKFNQSAKNTIDKIKELQKTSDASDTQAPLPSGRINPFAE